MDRKQRQKEKEEEHWFRKIGFLGGSGEKLSQSRL